MSCTGSPRVSSPTAASASACAPGPSPPTTSTRTTAEPCSRHIPQRREQQQQQQQQPAAAVLPRRTDTAPHTCFYFTVFFSNNPPIFHSNRIPPERLGSQAAGDPSHAAATATASPSSPCPGCQQEYWQSVFGEPGADRAGRPGVAFGTASHEDMNRSLNAAAVVGDYRTSMGTMEEVPLQTLQNVAFPTTFGSCGGTRVVPVRTLGNRVRSASLSSAPTTPLPPSVYPVSPAAAPSPTSRQPPSPTAARAPADTRTALGEVTAPLRSHYSDDAEKSQSTLAATAATATTIAGGGHTAQSTCVSSISTFNTLPLTNSSGTTTPLNGAAEFANGTAAEPAVAHRFKPTFPAVQWGEDEGREGGDAVAAASPASISAAPVAHGARVRAVGQVRTRRPRIATTPTAAAAAAEASNGRHTSSAAPSAVTAAPPPPPPAAPLRHFFSAAAAAGHADPTEQPRAARGPGPRVSPTTPAPSTGNATAAMYLAAPAAPTGLVSSVPPSTSPATVAAPSTAPGQEGPPWNMRVEEVRSAKGELRYYRIVLTVAFAALVTTHVGLMHSMQTRNAASALVLLCPPCGRHYRFLLQHADVLRSLSNRVTEFGIRTVQRFFGLLYSPTQKPNGSQQQMLKTIATLLETHPEAIETYRAVKAELVSALALRFPLPLLLPTTSAWTVPVLVRSSLSTARARSVANGGGGGGAAGGGNARTRRRGSLNMTGGSGTWFSADSSPTLCANSGASFSVSSPTVAAAPGAAAVPALADILYEAASFVREFSEGFASAYICGLLSLTAGGPGTRGLRTRRQQGASTVNAPITPAAAAAAAAAAASTTANAMSLDSPSVLAVEEMPNSAPRGGPSPTTTREASPLFAGAPSAADSAGGSRETPAWLSPYAAFFHTLSGVCDPLHGGSGGEDGVIDLSKPVAVALRGYGSGYYRRNDGRYSGESDADDDDDGALTAHVSISTMSSQTPVVSPLTIDVSSSNVIGAEGGDAKTRSPTLQFLCSRNSHAALSSNHVSPHNSATTYPAAAFAPVLSLGPPLSTSLTEPPGNGTAHTGPAAAAAVCAEHNRHSRANPPSLSSSTTATARARAIAGGGARGGLSAISSGDAIASAAAAGLAPPPPPPPPSNTSPKPAGAGAAREDEYVLHRERLGRVVIFTRDAVLARRLLVLAAFLWSDGATAAETTRALGRAGAFGTAAAASSRPHGGEESEAALRTAEAEHMYETAVAAAVSSAEYSNVPVQWVPEEFCETRISALCSPFSPENALLIVVPRLLQCRRVYLRKHVAGTTVLVEEISGKGARIRSAPFPFRCAVARQVMVQPDPTVTTLLREACTLHQSSRGTVSFAEVFQRMVRWLYWQTAATVMARETHAQASTRAASQASTQGGGGGVGGAALSRFTSADGVWPSSGLSAEGGSLSGDNIGSRLTTPQVVSPAVRLSHSSAFAHANNVSASSPVGRRDGALWGEAESSAEEALLPGSMGHASGAWAYTGNATASVGGSAAATAARPIAAAGPSLSSHPRGASVPVTSALLTSHGLVQPPSVFTSASPTSASPSKSASSFKFLNWFRPSPTTATGAATATAAGASVVGHSHPVLSPTTLGQMYSADGGVGGQLPRLLVGNDDDDEDGFFE